MPTVFRKNGFRFHFFSKEGPRAHIHVARGDGVAKIWLDTLEVAKAEGLTDAECRRVVSMVQEHREALQKAWDEFFSGI